MFPNFDEIIKHCLFDIETYFNGDYVTRQKFLKIDFDELEWIFSLHVGSGKHSMLYWRFEKELKNRWSCYEKMGRCCEPDYDIFYRKEHKMFRELFERLDSLYFINNKRIEKASV